MTAATLPRSEQPVSVTPLICQRGRQILADRDLEARRPMTTTRVWLTEGRVLPTT